MEELRETALAYYATLSENQKKEAVDFFRRMDADGNGYVTISEFMAFFPRTRSDYSRRMFEAFDKDGNGTIDFEEVITCYYVYVTGRMVFCCGCGDFLKGVYFTCSQCFHRTEQSSFDLCCTCFRGRNFTHGTDAIFYDNFALLRSTKHSAYNSQAQNRKSSGQTSTTSKEDEMLNNVKDFLEGFGMGTDLSVALAACNIM